MARIPGVNTEKADRYAKDIFAAQRETWGAPLLNHLIYARRPTIFRGVRAMWTGIDSSGLIEPELRALLNRRVAAINHCEFWQDINAAVGSELGISDEKIDELSEYATSALYSDKERVALEYADCMTITDLEVSDELFQRLQSFYSDDALVELTAVIAWENASSKFNRALRVDSQRLWKRRSAE